MNDLVAFLRARLDEDERAAAEATQETTGRWTARETDWGGGAIVEDGCGALILPTARHSATQYQHIARHDPARVLAEVEAKRRVLARHRIDPEEAGDWLWRDACKGCGAEGDCDDPVTQDINDCPELRDMAAVWSAHPDYRPEWESED